MIDIVYSLNIWIVWLFKWVYDFYENLDHVIAYALSKKYVKLGDVIDKFVMFVQV